jgi:hypothetical protein
MQVTARMKLQIEQASEYTGYPMQILRNAHARGELKAERPSGFERGRLYFDPVGLVYRICGLDPRVLGAQLGHAAISYSLVSPLRIDLRRTW